VVLRQRSSARTYELGQRIAVGGMGEVYEGRAPDISRHVAIKRMLNSEQSAEIKELFLREVAVCATLEHPNVVEVLDAGQNGSDLFLVMEYVEGPSLAELIDALVADNQLLPVEVTCGIIAQIARGLAHAHERSLPDGTALGIIHRDVAAANVLITRSGLPKLVDFGLAKLAGHDLTTPGTIRGRPRALSPEQARGERIDARSDVFSLGAMMFELASGQPLYPQEQLATVLWKVVAGDYDPIAARLPGVDPDLVGIIQTAVMPDPKDRFRSAREMERALDRFRAARGMRIDSSRIAGIITGVWHHVEKAREIRKTDGKGEMEGARLILAADRLDTSTTVEVPPELWKKTTPPRVSKPTTPRPIAHPSRMGSVPSSSPTRLPSLDSLAAPSAPVVEERPMAESPLTSPAATGPISSPSNSSLPKPEPERRSPLEAFDGLAKSDRTWLLLLGAIILVALVAFGIIWIVTT
jgi:serine/threonine-protein kinase